MSAWGEGAVKDKSIALLWAIWLHAGPNEASMQAWLDSVHVITSDSGVEAGIVDVPDILGCFMNWLRCGMRGGPPRDSQCRGVRKQWWAVGSNLFQRGWNWGPKSMFDRCGPQNPRERLTQNALGESATKVSGRAGAALLS